MQVQAARAVLVLGELELLGHARQVAASVAAVVVEYVPVGQFVHAAVRTKTFAPLRRFKILICGVPLNEFCPYTILLALAAVA